MIQEFIKALEEAEKSRILFEKVKGRYFSSYGGKAFSEVKEIELKEINVWDISFQSITFDTCTFEQLSFTDCVFHDCIFINCKFRNSSFSFSSFFDSDFLSCSFDGGSFAELLFSEVRFDDVCFHSNKELTGIRFGECDFNRLCFFRTSIWHVIIENRFPNRHINLEFHGSVISNCTFFWCKLTSAIFRQCQFAAVSFINCMLSELTIDKTNQTIESGFSSIDLQTILKSHIHDETLSKIFGVFSNDIKHYITEMVNKVELHTVFISFSFKDYALVKRIDEGLRSHGVFTFLWQKDAPGGKKLKEIMAVNIDRYDKVLFIASTNSLKSEACQFELSEARKKQEKNWGAVYFPIHIDNFLFSVKKFDIPREHREEFWKNIEELREINSVDFTGFNIENFELSNFEYAIRKLVNDLRRHD